MHGCITGQFMDSWTPGYSFARVLDLTPQDSAFTPHIQEKMR